MSPLTFYDLLDYIKEKWMNEKPEVCQKHFKLFEILREIYDYIYYERKWSHDRNSGNYPKKKDSLYDFVKKLFSELLKESEN
ncbi:MAG: hypothetical protein ACTSVK_00635 [Promethearchaeota archaeon]